jgi:glyoxylase-like metal-dependent hydrolase (beta-lactamase superfamily II)
MSEMHQSDDEKFIPMTSIDSGKLTNVSDDVAYYTNQIVNLIFIGRPGAKEWVLVDAGMPKCGPEILKVAEERYGEGNMPAAILLTHGHFDHVGSIVYLLGKWNIPVHAHPAEYPFLTGDMPYPEPDPTVEGDLLAKIASIYPNEPIDIKERLHMLPENGSVPFLPGWKWIHVPGHAPGQVAYFREADRLLLSGDAIITVRQDSLYRVLLQKPEVNGPPRYFTTDWPAAKSSVGRLQSLRPEIMISGHGKYMQGQELTNGIDTLVRDFDTIALPEHGKYV